MSTLAQLDAIRYDLDGGGWTGGNFPVYTAAFTNTVSGMGCPSTGCRGYELTADLDFDTNGNGRADSDDDYWNDGAGWVPLGLGDDDNGYTGEFHGNGHTISNLFINRSGTHIGLFGEVDRAGHIHHVGLLNVNVTGGKYTAALVGHANSNSIGVAASYATGRVAGGKNTGGLVGASEGWVVASWTAIRL